MNGLERRVGKNERDIQLAIKAIQSILSPSVPPRKNNAWDSDLRTESDAYLLSFLE